MANPPFNIKDWARDEHDPRWRFGVPPAGNANYGWIQHILSKLAPGGKAGVVMANGSMSSNTGGEGDDSGAASSRRTWCRAWSHCPHSCSAAPESRCACGFSARTRPTARARCCSSMPAGLAIWSTGPSASWPTSEIVRIGDTYHAWCGSASAATKGIDLRGYSGVLQVGAAGRDQSRRLRLTPGRYVGAPAADG